MIPRLLPPWAFRGHRTAAGAASLLVAAALIVSACGSPAPTARPTATYTPTSETPPVTMASPSQPAVTSTGTQATAQVPAFRHIYLVVMENKEYSSIVGSASAPFINSLIAHYGLATNLYAVAHPSQPNYIALTSGGTQGTSSDGTYNLAVPNLFDQVEAAGRTWHVYAQGYPGGCFMSYGSPSVTDWLGEAGDYARKHNPAISYTSISGDPAKCARITGLDGFDPAAADFEYVAPNQINDMHSSSVATGDAFLAAFVPKIVDAPAFANSLLIVTWDEGATTLGGGGHVATIALTPGMRTGARFDGTASTYSILRTIELAWGMPLLGDAATAPTLAFPWNG
jgi:phosphatidylinositol-3-phosphatase